MLPQLRCSVNHAVLRMDRIPAVQGRIAVGPNAYGSGCTDDPITRMSTARLPFFSLIRVLAVYTSRIYIVEVWTPMKTAEIFKHGNSQAVRLPKEFRFDGDEVLVRRSAG